MTKIIEEATRNGNDYKFPISMIDKLAEELAKQIISLAFLPQTRELVATLANGENIKATFAEATTSDTGLMSAVMVQKLEGIAKGAQVNSVTSVNNQTGAVNLGKADIGLDKVDNSADSEKSVYYATTSGAAAAADRAVSDANGNNIANTYLAKTGTASSASKLSTTQKINGVSYDGSEPVSYGGLCQTAAGTAAKTVSITNYTLTDYSTICVMFQNVNTAANPTLNVNSTGAKPIKLNNIATSKITTAAYQPVSLQYYSNAWHIIDPNANISADAPKLLGGFCSTAAATADKVVTINNFTLADYSTICVTFQNVNTAENPSLNVNGTGAKSIYLNGAATKRITQKSPQSVILQYYNGVWNIIDDTANSYFYSGTCSTAASGTTKTVNIPGFVPKDNVVVAVKFDESFSAKTLTTYLEVNGTRASIQMKNGDDSSGIVANSDDYNTFRSDRIYLFLYDSPFWKLLEMVRSADRLRIESISGNLNEFMTSQEEATFYLESGTNTPDDIGAGYLKFLSWATGVTTQILIDSNGSKIAIRSKSGSSNWTGWKKITLS